MNLYVCICLHYVVTSERRTGQEENEVETEKEQMGDMRRCECCIPDDEGLPPYSLLCIDPYSCLLTSEMFCILLML